MSVLRSQERPHWRGGGRLGWRSIASSTDDARYHRRMKRRELAWVGVRATFAFGVALTLGLVACGSETGSTGAGTGGGGQGGAAQGGQGGAAQGGEGGTSQGGAGQGGAGQGGSSQGGAGQGGGGAGTSTAECSTAEDCQLVNDCCACEGIPASEEPKMCNIDCLQPTCDSVGHFATEPLCEVGRCVAGFDCDHSTVTCDVDPPDCQPGHTAIVIDGCYGACVDAGECAQVGDCSQCNAAGHLCVTEQTQLGLRHHCVPLPGECQGDPTCACMGASVCLAPFDTCSDSATGVTCSCPAC